MVGCAGECDLVGVGPVLVTMESVRRTEDGDEIDLHCRVTDVEQANRLLGPSTRPLLIDQATGRQMAVPMTAKLGPLRQTQARQKADHLYFVMFTNTAGLVPGSKVTARLGDINIADLTVQ